ncbi:MAG: mechanosensitive ion channel domain-containing protein [Fervidicoccaceae archaeon]
MSKESDGFGRSLSKLIIYIILVAIILAVVNYIFNIIIPQIAATFPQMGNIIVLKDYYPYINAILVLILGWLIVSSTANAFYAMLKPKYGISAAGAVRSLVRILGIAALIAGVGGSAAGGAAGVALGGFIGMIVGYATQQVLGQAVAGIFVLLARPFKIGDSIDAAGESEVQVTDIGTLFTIVKRKDGNMVLIPNNTMIGQKIVIHESAQKG